MTTEPAIYLLPLLATLILWPFLAFFKVKVTWEFLFKFLILVEALLYSIYESEYGLGRIYYVLVLAFLLYVFVRFVSKKQGKKVLGEQSDEDLRINSQTDVLKSFKQLNLEDKILILILLLFNPIMMIIWGTITCGFLC